MFTPIRARLKSAIKDSKWPSSSSSSAWLDMFHRCWYLGLTSFGGPAVHFQIFRQLFVEKYKWLDHQMYQELFALCQALPGPGSTKMIYCINLIHAGFLPALVSFFIWSLPAAIAAFGLALGIAEIGQRLPDPVYALLSGLNAATVGIIFLAAVQLSQKAVTDKLSRILVFFGATAGMLYNALWYFPILMVVAGISTIVWDYRWLQDRFKSVRSRYRPKRKSGQDVEATEKSTNQTEPTPQNVATQGDQPSPTQSHDHVRSSQQIESHHSPSCDQQERIVPPALRIKLFAWRSGIAIILGFFTTFIIIMVLRGVLQERPRGFNLFANLYLAGTIIFGGGPVVIPLLREYIVAEGWVSPRDFLLGLAIIQAFPGPNFNCEYAPRLKLVAVDVPHNSDALGLILRRTVAVYLGTLSAKGTALPTAAGALIGYIAIFTPGLVLHTGTMGLWQTLRCKRWFTSCLRGVNASAVGLVYTAVYRLWLIGFIDADNQQGSSLGRDPWWVVVTATSFVGGMWFSVQAPVAILLGGIMGMVWYGVVSA